MIALLVCAAICFQAACSLQRADTSQTSTSPAEVAPVQPGPVRITMFYAYPERPPADEKTLLCYGVENADEVRLVPAVDRVWPSPTRCVEAPARAATYTLTASRGNEKVSQSLKVMPVPPKVKLIEVSINKLEIAPGEEITVCYKAKNATNVTIKPGAWIEPHRLNLGCARDKPLRTTTYVVTTTGAGGDTDSERVTARLAPSRLKP